MIMIGRREPFERSFPEGQFLGQVEHGPEKVREAVMLEQAWVFEEPNQEVALSGQEVLDLKQRGRIDVEIIGKPLGGDGRFLKVLPRPVRPDVQTFLERVGIRDTGGEPLEQL